MPNLMKIGDLAKQTGLSIRTLRYYDEIRLLSPSHRTEAGHRLYATQDIIRLQQILSLRQLGFSLSEIHHCLETPGFSLPQVIDLHLARLQEQMELSRTLFRRLGAIAQDLKTTRSVSIENLLEAMETLTMTTQYLTQDQQDMLEARLNKGRAEWQDLLSRIKSAMEQGQDLNSPEMQQMAWHCRETILAFVGGDRQIYEALISLYQREGAEAASWGTLDANVLDYILKAVGVLSLRENLVNVSFDRFTPDAMRVLSTGQDAVRELHLNFLGTEGLLLGLLATQPSHAYPVLNEAGVEFNRVQALLRDWLGAVTVTLDEIPAEIPFTPRAYRVLELAAEQAKQLDALEVNTGHVLLGILKEGETGGGMAMRALVEGYGIQTQVLEQKVKEAIALR